MLKTVATALIAIALAVGGGAASVAYVLDDTAGTGAVSFGPWTAFRSIGSQDADPYSRARISREGILALGEGEGLAFVAETDSGGSRLHYGCTYRIEGVMPPARFWTMFVEPVEAIAQAAKAGALQSRAVIRNPDNAVVVTIGRNAAPGNWLQVSGEGQMRIVVTLYDFSLATQTAEPGALMPGIIQAGCDV